MTRRADAPSPVASVIMVVALLLVSGASAELLVVTSSADQGDGTLRWAIAEAEANAEADEIVFELDPVVIYVQSAFPRLYSEVRLTGNGHARTIIDISAVPGPYDGVFNVRSSASLSLDSLTISNAEQKRAVHSIGHVEISSCRFLNHRSTGSALHLVNSTSSAVIRDSVFAGNICGLSGGVINADHADVLIERCTFADNYSEWYGGAIAALWSTFTVRNCTFSNNRAARSGKVLYFYGGTTATLENLTLTGDTVDEPGGDILVWGPNTVRLSNTIIGGGCDSRDGGHVTSLGHNLERGDTCGLEPGHGDVVGANPLLGPLQDNGGSTLTHALLPGSKAIDRGGTCAAHDQRVMPRPIDGDDDGVAICDIGAVEHQRMIFYDGLERGDAWAWARQ